MDLDEMYPSGVDVANDVEVYRKGKSFECPECGQGTGVTKERVTWKCPKCNIICYDSDWGIREEQDFIKVVEDDQSKLSKWT
jgi:predicted RNA-binding Zn-ribbon protein involved in translation (DUF1610 family)